jgi:hypothetical protein
VDTATNAATAATAETAATAATVPAAAAAAAVLHAQPQSGAVEELRSVQEPIQ